jgi:hypothetical protein
MVAFQNVLDVRRLKLLNLYETSTSKCYLKLNREYGHGKFSFGNSWTPLPNGQCIVTSETRYPQCQYEKVVNTKLNQQEK